MIYEAHVKGLTRLHPEVPEEERGSYLGLAHPAIIEHLQRLGITAIELMPVHQFVSDSGLEQRGLSNYWGYNTIGFFAPHNAYAASGQRGQQVQEFKAMVRAMHEAGIEVILDVVYNHTAEGNQLGPTLSFRGLDNTAYYRLVDDDPQYYMDTTGTGNSLLMRNPQVLQLIMDSLRYWVIEMHVDGFRFDLAAALARQFHEVDRLSSFFDVVQQDPIVSQVKLIAEPWDVGDGGYQVGNFPPLWSEWNGKYRDTVRDFWRGQSATLPEFASRLTGSSDLYQSDGRSPVASINFVTAHDGFTLADLVSYDHKHNEANGEDNRDGTDDNRSWNCGAEGPDRRPGHRRAAGPPAAQLPGHPAAVPGRADAAGRRRAGPHPAGQQQRLLPGQRDLLGGWAWPEPSDMPNEAAAGLHPRADQPADEPPGVPAAAVLPGRADLRGARPGRGHRLVHPRRRGDDRRGLVGRLRQVADRVPERRRHQRARPARPAGPRRLVPAAVQRQRDRPQVRHPARPLRRAVDRGCSTPSAGQAAEARRGPGRGDRTARRHRSRWAAARSRSCASVVADRPGATYRLQLHREFGFAAAAAVAGYLAALGVTHVYLSPILQAAPGSMHGYDVVDHSRVSDDLGGEDGFRAMVAAFRRHGLGVVVDVVPNHMGIGAPESLNRQFWSVLAEGAGSRYAHWFDIDWAARGGRLLLPILGGPVGRLRRRPHRGPATGGEPVLRYFEHVLPLAPGTADLPLDELLGAQHYELADWRLAATELNWRRFFDVTTLIGVQVQEPDVFAATHDVLLRLYAEGLIDGLRIDHPDGLADPRGYLRRLATATGGGWVVTEKILTGDEQLPADWDCAGTTGYDAWAGSAGCSPTPPERAR